MPSLNLSSNPWELRKLLDLNLTSWGFQRPIFLKKVSVSNLTQLLGVGVKKKIAAMAAMKRNSIYPAQQTFETTSLDAFNSATECCDLMVVNGIFGEG